MKTNTWALLILLWAGIFSPALLQGQHKTTPKPISAGFLVGIHTTTRGFGLELGLLRGPERQQFLYGIDLHVVRDAHEMRTESFYQSQGRRYVFGKLNHFLVLHPSVGIQKNIVPRSFLSLVNLQMGLKAGPSIGLLNPYFLEIFEPSPGNPISGGRIIEAYDPAVHSYGRIIGRANLVSSQIELNARVGLGIKAYTLIDFARSQRFISALKLSVHMDVFTSPVPIMEETEQLPQRQLFITFGAGLVLGNRW